MTADCLGDFERTRYVGRERCLLELALHCAILECKWWIYECKSAAPGASTFFGHVLDPSHPPFQHSCGYPESSMVWKHFNIHIATPFASCNLHMDSIILCEPPGTAHSILTGHFQSLNLKLFHSLHYPNLLLHCYPPMLPASVQDPHCPPLPDVVFGGLFVTKTARRTSWMSWDDL